MTNWRNKRKHYFINKGLQLRYMAVVCLPILVVCAVSFFSLYHGIWADFLGSFTNAKVQEDLFTASRMLEYEQSRYGMSDNPELSSFKAAEKLGARQQEIFKEILNEVNKNTARNVILVFFLIAIGTIYISHKIAGPLYHIKRIAKELEEGNYRARIHLRKWDEAGAVADQINAAIDKTDKRFSALKNLTKETEPAKSLEAIKKELSDIKTSSDA